MHVFDVCQFYIFFTKAFGEGGISQSIDFSVLRTYSFDVFILIIMKIYVIFFIFFRFWARILQSKRKLPALPNR